eukprot:CAMPEP_0183829494 /NCGR_PEP_ID=MMETSP0807_2-20130328/3350_1 /TAXON_ID=88271 /ORGANISM="Picocystis salinarum, Strain CCMP1897" /LENGTH=54 /DNA_ID=CAMNT_0026074719 /DNA_START=93 /DNA_END=257 /DNA_ORIENTATION=+
MDWNIVKRTAGWDEACTIQPRTRKYSMAGCVGGVASNAQQMNEMEASGQSHGHL